MGRLERVSGRLVLQGNLIGLSCVTLAHAASSSSFFQLQFPATLQLHVQLVKREMTQMKGITELPRSSWVRKQHMTGEGNTKIETRPFAHLPTNALLSAITWSYRHTPIQFPPSMMHRAVRRLAQS